MKLLWWPNRAKQEAAGVKTKKYSLSLSYILVLIKVSRLHGRLFFGFALNFNQHAFKYSLLFSFLNMNLIY